MGEVSIGEAALCSVAIIGWRAVGLPSLGEGVVAVAAVAAVALALGEVSSSERLSQSENVPTT